jgi:hypothetical protein
MHWRAPQADDASASNRDCGVPPHGRALRLPLGSAVEVDDGRVVLTVEDWKPQMNADKR